MAATVGDPGHQADGGRTHPGDEVLDLLVVGAGIVGLATASAVVARHPGWRVAVIDKEPRVASHQTGHNSGVIHCGIYYRPGTFKARLCRAGASRMLDFCERRSVPVRQPGKLIVATTTHEVPILDELARRGEANGVPGVRLLDRGAMAEIEPNCGGLAALHCPSTAVVDFGMVAGVLAADLGDRLHLGMEVTSVRQAGSELRVEAGGATLATRRLVNCGGLQADRIAASLGADPGARIVPFLGQYHALDDGPARLVRGLIYPVPLPGVPFLGVHLTRMIDDRVLAGPNALLALDREGYRVARWRSRDVLDIVTFPGSWRLAAKMWRVGLQEWWLATNRRAFGRAVQRLVPALDGASFHPAGSGVRAQAVGRDGSLIDDFVFARSPRALHVVSAPSPAATASLVIADHLADEVDDLQP